MGLLDGKVAIVTGRGRRHRPRAGAALREGGGERRRERPGRRARRHRLERRDGRARSSAEIAPPAATAAPNFDDVSTAEGARRNRPERPSTRSAASTCS